MVSFPRKDELVDVACRFCQRGPRTGERYGPGADQWDFTGICPECWNATMAEPEQEEEG
jgi:hypothetical protein